MAARRTRWRGESLEAAQSVLWDISSHFVHLGEFSWDDEFTEWEDNVLELAELIKQARKGEQNGNEETSSREEGCESLCEGEGQGMSEVRETDD